MKILAIDPGGTCGIAIIRIKGNDVFLPGEDQVKSISPGHVYAMLQHPMPGEFDVVVCEEFRLYPWMASHLGFNEFHTCEVIGVIKYLTALAGVPLYMQQTGIKKEARTLAEQHGWPMVERSLGSGKGKYRGPDFDYKGPQHGRDALAHAAYWAWRNSSSPAYEG